MYILGYIGRTAEHSTPFFLYLIFAVLVLNVCYVHRELTKKQSQIPYVFTCLANKADSDSDSDDVEAMEHQTFV